MAAQAPLDDRASPAYIDGRGWKYRVSFEPGEHEVYADPRPLHEIRLEAQGGVIAFRGIVIDANGPRGAYRALVGKGDVRTVRVIGGVKTEELLTLRYDDGFEEAQVYASADDNDDADDDGGNDGDDAQAPASGGLPPLGRIH